MNISHFDHSRVEEVREAAKKALEEVAKRYGLTVEFQGGKFNHTSYEPKFKFGVVRTSESGQTLDVKALDFQKHCHQYSLHPSQLFGTFVTGGNEYQITGLEPKRTKRPIVCKRLDNGSNYLFTPEDIIKVMDSGRLKLVKP